MSVATQTRLEDLTPLKHDTALLISADETSRLLDLLRELRDDEWLLPTDCDRWTVRDVIAHLTGWAELFTSFGSAKEQLGPTLRWRKQFENMVDAQNEAQVELKRHLSPEQLTAEYEKAAFRFLKLRRRIGTPGKLIPIYSALFGWKSLSFVADSIFTRDTFMHRVDISRATGRDFRIGQNQEALIADIVRDWARLTKTRVRVELEGPGGGLFTHESPVVTVRTDAIDFCRFNAGRFPEDKLDVQGPQAEVERALSVRAPF